MKSVIVLLASSLILISSAAFSQTTVTVFDGAFDDLRAALE